MANYDNPNGFAPVTFPARANKYTTSAVVTKGDALAIASGAVLPYVLATHDQIVGIAAHDAESGAEVLVYDDPDTEFVGQCSGTFATSMIGSSVDIEGTTGIMEIDENGSTDQVATIVGHYPVAGSTEVGANSRVKFRLTGHTNLGV